MNKEETTKKQVEFIDWLKKRDMYYNFDSAEVMQRMFEVWLKSADSNPELVVVNKSDLMTWYDVLAEAISTPQYDHKQRSNSVIRQMIKLIQRN